MIHVEGKVLSTRLCGFLTFKSWAKVYGVLHGGESELLGVEINIFQNELVFLFYCEMNHNIFLFTPGSTNCTGELGKLGMNIVLSTNATCICRENSVHKEAAWFQLALPETRSK